MRKTVNEKIEEAVTRHAQAPADLTDEALRSMLSEVADYAVDQHRIDGPCYFDGLTDAERSY